MKEIKGKLILVRVSVRFELARVRVIRVDCSKIKSQRFLFDHCFSIITYCQVNR